MAHAKKVSRGSSKNRGGRGHRNPVDPQRAKLVKKLRAHEEWILDETLKEEKACLKRLLALSKEDRKQGVQKPIRETVKHLTSLKSGAIKNLELLKGEDTRAEDFASGIERVVGALRPATPVGPAEPEAEDSGN